MCYSPAVDCDQTGLEMPIWNYSHDLGNAVIGGYVYHGQALPSIECAYIYGDFGSGNIWALTQNSTGTTNTLIVDSALNIASFGVDQQNEIYITAYDGKIYKLSAAPIPEYPSLTVVVVVLVVVALLAIFFIKKPNNQSNR